MGIYRLLLAALVVFFHFGGLSWIAGRVAVFAFYCASGFLIFQALDKVYADQRRGIWRFYGNRLLRLGPLYVAYVVMTLAVVRWIGADGPLRPGTGTPLLENMQIGSTALLGNALTFSPWPHIVNGLPVLEFKPYLIPQGWSIGVELMCYLLAPLAVLTTRRRPLRLSIWIGVGLVVFLWGVWAAGLDSERFQYLVYKNTFTSVVVFLAGGAIYYLRRRWGQPVPFGFVGLLIAAWVAVVTIRAFRLGEGPSARLFTEYVWLTVALTGLVATTRIARLQRFDTALGNLCYGVYLNHFLVAGVLLGLGAERHVPRPGTLIFACAVLVGSLLLATTTYFLVERQFDRVRTRVRSGAAPDAAHGDYGTRRARLLVAAAALGMLLFVRPVGFIAARSSLAGAGALASSPEFNIRWKQDLAEMDRLRIEGELGLENLGEVERDPRRRTWTYRLRVPTFPGLRAVLAHFSVDDTSLDAAQLEMLRE